MDPELSDFEIDELRALDSSVLIGPNDIFCEFMNEPSKNKRRELMMKVDREINALLPLSSNRETKLKYAFLLKIKKVMDAHEVLFDR